MPKARIPCGFCCHVALLNVVKMSCDLAFSNLIPGIDLPRDDERSKPTSGAFFGAKTAFCWFFQRAHSVKTDPPLRLVSDLGDDPFSLKQGSLHPDSPGHPVKDFSQQWDGERHGPLHGLRRSALKMFSLSHWVEDCHQVLNQAYMNISYIYIYMTLNQKTC